MVLADTLKILQQKEGCNTILANYLNEKAYKHLLKVSLKGNDSWINIAKSFLAPEGTVPDSFYNDLVSWTNLYLNKYDTKDHQRKVNFFFFTIYESSQIARGLIYTNDINQQSGSDLSNIRDSICDLLFTWAMGRIDHLESMTEDERQFRNLSILNSFTLTSFITPFKTLPFIWPDDIAISEIENGYRILGPQLRTGHTLEGLKAIAAIIQLSRSADCFRKHCEHQERIKTKLNKFGSRLEDDAITFLFSGQRTAYMALIESGRTKIGELNSDIEERANKILSKKYSDRGKISGEFPDGYWKEFEECLEIIIETDKETKSLRIGILTELVKTYMNSYVESNIDSSLSNKYRRSGKWFREKLKQRQLPNHYSDDGRPTKELEFTREQVIERIEKHLSDRQKNLPRS